MEIATFAAGCFWGVEAEFRRVPGVLDTMVGYTGGHLANPTYRDVCTGTTGHAEAVQVQFDPQQVSYERLLEIFWELHDPTTPNRQGPDVGTQYRSAVFFHSPEQESAARASRERIERGGQLEAPIVTEIVRASAFYRAEEYHQRYAEKRGVVSCHVPRRA
jgi:peptide-methionine (S)-S-oxide reductase